MKLLMRLPLRITIPFFLFLAVLIIVIYSMQHELRSSDVEEERDARAFVVQAMTELQGEVNSLLRKGAVEDVQRIMANMGSNPNIAVVALLDEGGIVHSSTALKLTGLPAKQALPDMDIKIMREVRETGTGKTFSVKERNFVYGYYPVGWGNLLPPRTGILFMCYDFTNPINTHRIIIKRNGLLSIIFYSLLFLLLWLFMRYTMMRRVEQLVSVAREFGAGNLHVRTGFQGKDELAQIGEAFDRMAEKIIDDQIALRKREAQLNESQRLAHIGSWDWDALIDTIWWSEEYYRIYGLDPKKPTPNYVEHLKAYTSESAARLDTAVKRAMEIGEPYELDLELANPTAETRWIVARGEAKRNAGGKIWGLRGTAQNITERKRVEEAARTVNLYNRSLIEASLDPLVTIGPDGKITDVNEATETVTGLSRERLIGDDFLNYFTEPEKAREGYRKVLAEGLVRDYPLTIRHASGNTTDVLYNAAVYKNEAGEIQGVFAAARDVTERKRVEEELKESEARYRLIVDTANEGIWMLGEDLMTTFVNARMAEMIGYRAEELIGQPLTAYMFDEDETDHYSRMEKRRQGLSEHYERRFRHKNGQTLWILVSAVPIFDEGRNFKGTFGMFTDITGLKKMESDLREFNVDLGKLISDRTFELQESQKALMNIVEDLNEKTDALVQANDKLKELDRMKSIFIAGMSHELRTPLNSIIGFSSILLNEWTGPLTAEQKENLSIILRGGKHLLSLINDVIDVSKVEAGIIDKHVDDFDIYDVIAEAVATLAKNIKDKGLELRVEAVHQQMHTDRRRLLQCVLNLMSNAVKFTEKGSITVQASISEIGGKELYLNRDFVEISVADTGIGIKEENLPKLFNAFVRLELPGNATIPGTGLGLYLTKKLLSEVLKGEIICRSKYGEGSTFAMKAPVRIE